MTKRKGLTKAAVHIQEDLDCVTGALIGWEMCERLVRLRIDQACQRTGERELLIPALDELDSMVKRVQAARLHISQALSRLTE